MANCECSEDRRFKNIEEEMKELKDKQAKHEQEINDIKFSQAESKIYVKQIFERLDDLKALFTTGHNADNKQWTGLITEMLKTLVTVAGIIAAMKFSIGG